MDGNYSMLIKSPSLSECDTHVVDVAELHVVLGVAVLLGLGQGGGGGQREGGHDQAQSPHAGHRDLTITHNHPRGQHLYLGFV